MHEISKLLGQMWQSLPPESQLEYKMISMYMRDSPIEGVPLTTREGIEIYRDAVR